ncbi:9854_t:CDS:2, partial [Entrophospora sp. SA101]
EQAKVQQRDILWSVVDELTNAFNLPDPTEHGLKCLNELLYQEVYKTLPCSTVGRQTEIRDNIPVLVEDITVAPVNEILQVETTPHKSHKKTDKELEMLQEAFSHPTDLPKD